MSGLWLWDQTWDQHVPPGSSKDMLYHSGSSRLKQHPDRFTGGMSRKHPFSCGIGDHPLPWSYCKILFLICLGANSLSKGRLWKFVKSVEQKNSVFLPWGHKPQSVLTATLSSTNWVAQKFWALQATVLLQFIWTDIFLPHFPSLSPLWYSVQYILAEV